MFEFLSSGDPQDAPLLADARLGDADAIVEICQKYLDPIYQFARVRLNDAPSAERATAATFNAMIDAFREGDAPRRGLRAWLFGLAAGEVDQAGAKPVDPVDAILQIAEDETERLRHAVRQLPDDQQTALLLRFGGALSLGEAARVLGGTANTAKTLQFRAVTGLHEALAPSAKTSDNKGTSA